MTHRPKILILGGCLVASSMIGCSRREVIREVQSGERRVGPGEVPETVRRAQEGPLPKITLSAQDVVANGSLEERSMLARVIWGSPLGRLYSDYLFSRSTPIENLRKVTKIVDRLFSESLWTINRVSALQLMTEDLYNSGKVDPAINDRIGLMLLNLSLRRHALEVESAHEIGWQSPLIAVIGFLAGSPAVRSRVALGNTALKHVAKWLISFGSRTELKSARTVIRRMDWRGLISRDFFEQYSPWHAILYGSAAFATYSSVYYGFKTGSADSASPAQKTLLYNLQELVDLTRL